MTVFKLAIGMIVATALTVQGAQAANRGLIPRADFFDTPARDQVEVSPDGSMLSFTAPLDGVKNVWIAPVSHPAEARAVTHDKNRGIFMYQWARNSRDILYPEDDSGRMNDQLFAVDVTTGASRPLVAVQGAMARIVAQSVRRPDEMLVSINDRDPRWPDVYRVNVRTASRTLVYKNEGVAWFTADSNLDLRYAGITTAEGGVEVKRFAGGGKLVDYLSIPPDDTITTHLLGLDVPGTTLYAMSSLGRNTAALVALDPVTARQTVIGSSDKVDLWDFLTNPETGRIEAYAVNYLKTQWVPLDPKIRADLEFIRAHAGGGQWRVAAQSDDDRTWIVFNDPVTETPYYWLYNRDSKTLTRLFTMYPQLVGKQLAPVHPLVIKARDGLELTAYLTLPADADKNGGAKPDAGPLPMVLFVHGGPTGREMYGFDGYYNIYHQWLANRGYAALAVNFRGSAGFGKAFVNAGNRQWGGAMEDDLIDAVNWTIENGIAQRGKVAIMGASYGGYATLASLSMHPKTFACGIDLFGPADLETLLATVPPALHSFYNMMMNQIGDPRTPEGLALLKKQSPLTYVGNIERPLLIGQGVNDVAVTESQSDMIVKAMEAKNLPVTYVLYAGEGHGFVRPQNNISFNAIAEGFLAKYLGGSYEPIGDAFKGSTLKVMTGADEVPGLKEALAH